MTREKVLERIEELKKELGKIISQHTAVTGQLNETEWWLRIINGVAEPE